MERTSGDVTGALVAIREGDEQAFGRLVELVYHDLRRIARSQRRRRAVPAAPLETTALVHETYLRLVDQTRAGYRDRGHFFTAWAQAMRRDLLRQHRQRHRPVPGSSHTFTFGLGGTVGIGYEHSYETSAAAGIRSSCAQASGAAARACVTELQKCLEDRGCPAAGVVGPVAPRAAALPVGTGTPAPPPASTPSRPPTLPAPPGGATDASTVGDAPVTTPQIPTIPGSHEDDRLRRGAARIWFEELVERASLDHESQRALLVLIGQATRRYDELGQEAREGPRSSTVARGVTARRAPREPPASDTEPSPAPPRPRPPAEPEGRGPFASAATRPEIDELFLRRALGHLERAEQERALVDSWPGGVLIFGSGFVAPQRPGR